MDLQYSLTTMLGCIIFFATLVRVSHGVTRVKCDATSSVLNFTITDTGNSKNNVESVSLYLKTSTPRDPWVKQDDCQLVSTNIMTCSSNRENNAQHFKIEWFYKEDGTGATKNMTEELWFYNCFKDHGVRYMSAKTDRWNQITVQWKHYNVDQNFIKNDMIKIVDLVTREHMQVDSKKIDEKLNVYKYNSAQGNTTYDVCIWTIFYGSFDSNGTISQFQKTTDEKCMNVTTPAKPPPSSTDLKVPLLAVGIGVLCLILICVMFVVYNKKCKQGGDHDYDMNRDETLIGGEGQNGDELQQYTNGEKTMLQDGDAEEKDIENDDDKVEV